VEHASESAGISTARRVRPYLTVVGVFLVAALISTPVLSRIEDGLGMSYSSPALRAWIQYPNVATQGIKQGSLLGVAIVPPTEASVRWSATSRGVLIGNGTASSVPGTPVHVHVFTARASRHSWLVVHVAGLAVPLKVWVR
jgi:hypothetical protein